MKFLNGLLIFWIAAQPAFAQMQVGKYRGSDKSGESCEFEVQEISYKEGVENPLNFVAKVRYENRVYDVTHVPRVSETEFLVLADEGRWVATRGRHSVNEALLVRADEGEKVPAEFVFVKHYPDFPGFSNRYYCLELKHRP